MQVTSGKAFWLATTIAGSTIMGQGIAGAQETSTPIMAVEEVVVTARKVQENVQDVPISMSAISGRKLEQARGFTVESLNNIVPNVKVFKTVGNSNAYGIFVRGIGRDNNAFIVESPIATYVDDVYYPYTAGAVLDAGGLERVEVLRGPQGTLYGRNATVGAIKYVTARPNLTAQEGSFSVTGGSFGRREERASFSTPLIDDTLAVRFDQGYSHYNGYMRDALTGEALGGVDSISGRLSTTYRPNEKLEIYVSVDGLQSRDATNVGTPLLTVGDVSTPVYGSPYLTRNTIATNLNNLDVYGGTVQATYDMDFGVLKSVSAYRSVRQQYALDANSGVNDAGLLNSAGNSDGTFTQELQLTGNLASDRLKYVAGFFFMNSDLTTTYVRPAATNTTIYNAKSIAGYVDGTFAVTDEINLSAGIRYTKDSKEATTTRIGAVSFVQDGEGSWTALTPRVGADWKVMDNVMLYTSWGKGFKGGALTTQEPSVAAAAAVFVPPEKIRSTEVGFKSEWWDGRVVLNADYFWASYTDQAQTILAGDPLVTNVVFADAHIEGLEVELHAQVTDRWRVDISGGTLDNYFTRIPAGNPAANFADKTLKHSPKLAYVLSTDYTLTMPFDLGGSLALGTSYSWTDSTWESVQKVPLAFQPSYGTLDLRAVYTTEDDRYQVVFAGTNVTNTKYFKVVTVPYTRWYAPPAEWSVTFRAKL